MKEPIPLTIGPGKRFKRRLKKLALRLPMRPLIRFAYAYVLRLGFLDGRPGLIFCGLLAFYDFLASANRYEQQIARAGSSGDERSPRVSAATATPPPSGNGVVPGRPGLRPMPGVAVVRSATGPSILGENHR
jgi:hypothetical protein